MFIIAHAILYNSTQFTPKSAIWHKIPLETQYLVNLYHILTAKSSWTDLSFEGIKSYLPPLWDLINHPYKLCNFSLLAF